MKKLIISACSIILIIGCTNQNLVDLEKRIATLEKSSTVKDKQIEGLSYLAYFSLLDTTTNIDDSTKNDFTTKLFTKNALFLPKKCQAECIRTFKITINSCRTMACKLDVINRFERCTNACNPNPQ